MFSNGLTHAEAARKMGVSRQAVSKLIAKIRKKYPTGVPVAVKPIADKYWRISWSETAQIAAARIDKICPVCLCNRRNGFIIKVKYGECWRCGWTFSFEEDE